MSERPLHRFVVEDSDVGERLDRFLAAKGVASRSEVQRWIDEGRVLVDDARADSKTKLRLGQAVSAQPAPPLPSAAEPEDIPLDIRFEDDHLIVVMKPAGMVVHPAPGHARGTLVNALLHHARFEEGGDPSRPGIVHRLDKDTSGVMVVAKSARARDGLVALLQRHDVERRYDALALGMLAESRTFETLHGRHPTDRKRFSSKVARGKRAVTHVTVVEPLHGATRIACRLETGRTHQIRVHLADAGFPLLADPLYGRNPNDPRVRAASDALARQALHAAVLGFVHPVTNERVRVEADPPDDFQRALLSLRMEP
ncbi:MAG: RluA family pseudouridine synthase [Myxococcales bacterium]|nr:RluA family pseudouridine synthase [Myxococcales bacterium]